MKERRKVPKAPLWGGSTDGPEALPGNYQVKLTVLGQSYTAPLEIVPDPRLSVTPADLAEALRSADEDSRPGHQDR